MRRATYISIILAILVTSVDLIAQRRITPVNTPATRTQSRNDVRGDSLRALQRKRDRSIHYHDENGNVILVDTVTGLEWVDSTLLPKPPKMKYPLLHSLTVGVNIFDPLMRAFGAKYGGADASIALSLHNRYIPVFEFGLGAAKKTPDHSNFSYRTPLAPYFRLGMDYNFIYNSNPDYVFTAGVRYGFSAFRYSISDATLTGGYWGEDVKFSIPSTAVNAGWVEFSLGLQVRLWGHVSAGWRIRYQSLLHQSHPASGDAWYIPGFGPSTSSLSASFSFYYTLPWPRRKAEVHVESDHPSK